MIGIWFPLRNLWIRVLQTAMSHWQPISPYCDMQAPSKKASKMALREGWATVACSPLSTPGHLEHSPLVLSWGDSKAFLLLTYLTSREHKSYWKNIWIKFQDLIWRQETSRQAPRSFPLLARALLFFRHCTETAILWQGLGAAGSHSSFPCSTMAFISERLQHSPAIAMRQAEAIPDLQARWAQAGPQLPYGLEQLHPGQAA